MSKSAQQRWSDHRDRILEDIGSRKIARVEIPGWQPVSFDEGMRWLQATHYEGFKADHNLLANGEALILQLRSWEE
ncbi:hypothetical protein [Novosphingobium sp. ES2-1]|uniref:hypothetical protein n=2 Tax=Novosphingobium TaxID=165696 RepID=UPI0018814491|nr:hypothetical protein [Novosphingobium sp. ES2-1]QOV94260.1 hypothetical protein IM701_01855 [Novosphingobium sp. ES2-1]